jgi:hypothetical protein
MMRCDWALERVWVIEQILIYSGRAFYYLYTCTWPNAIYKTTERGLGFRDVDLLLTLLRGRKKKTVVFAMH